MAITDLTGCVWVANNNISASNSPTTYNINFSNNNISGSNVKIPLANYSYGKVFSSGVNGNTFNDLCLNSSNQWIIYNNDDEYVVETIGTLEITFTGGSDVTNATLISWLEANGTLTAPQPTANTYTITHSLTNVSKGNMTFVITPDTGYELPDTITVTNGTLVSYDKTTGVVVVSGDDNTTVSCECAMATPSGYEVELNGDTGLGEYVYVQINNDPTWYYARLATNGGVGFLVSETNIPNAYQKTAHYSIGIPNVSTIRIGTQGNPTNYDGPRYETASPWSTGDFVNLTFTSTGSSAPAYATGEITMTQDSKIYFAGDF